MSDPHFKTVSSHSVARGMRGSTDGARLARVLVSFRDDQGQRSGQYDLTPEQASKLRDDLATQLTTCQRPEGER